MSTVTIVDDDSELLHIRSFLACKKLSSAMLLLQQHPKLNTVQLEIFVVCIFCAPPIDQDKIFADGLAVFY